VALRDPQRQFVLVGNADGKKRFREMRSHTQTITISEPWTCRWTLTNGYAEQPAGWRIEALVSAAPVSDTGALLLADFARETNHLVKSAGAEGVSFSVLPADRGAGQPGVTLCATNLGKVPRKAAWLRLEKRFDPPFDAKDAKALGLEIEGDGSGAMLAIRLESPQHLAYGAVADRYVTLDFTGRRRLTLVETESSRWSDYVWNDGKHLYGVYRELVNFGVLESVSLWLQNLPAGRETRVSVGPIHALPFRPVQVKNPRLTVNGHSLEFPIDLASGSWIEANSPADCRVYGPKGQDLGRVSPVGDWPKLPTGANSVSFSCGVPGEPGPRARVTAFCYGETL